MKRNPNAIHTIQQLLGGIERESDVLRMKTFRQHGTRTTYDHCVDVACLSYQINRKLHLHADERDLLTAAMLHDFYLYDWHDAPVRKHWNELFQLHGFAHPSIAAKNAREKLGVNQRVESAIRTHMWPLTLRAIPRSREAWIVCLADKICATIETVHRFS